jgi:hypothetical protein
MSKLSISVEIPAIAQQHEFLVPNTMAVKDVVTLMAKILASEYGVANDTSELMLFDKQDGKALRMECSLSQLGISDSAKLTLF